MSNQTFVQYIQRLGYPERLARLAVSRLGDSATTNELLSAVMADARRYNIRPAGSYRPQYLLKQDSYRLRDGSSKIPKWVNFQRD
jgi:hypothetical protein